MVRVVAMDPRPGCPERSRLVAFDRGLLAPVDLEAVGVHLSSCGRCTGILDDLHSRSDEDPFIGRVRRCLEWPPPRIPPACADMAAAARALGSTEILPGLDDPASGSATGVEPAIDRPIGQYVLRGKIGQGGMGVVYRALQRPLDRPVALKMVLAGHHAGASALARFLVEGKAIARLSHPNVVQVYELGEHDGLPYLAMELVEGGSLQARLAGGPLEPRVAAGLVRTLALAVEYAHGEGVIHRDLKPSNILLARDGTPRITDFGLAKLLDPGSDGPAAAGLTGSDEILGTASYMAPEQAEGRSADIGPETDVYALGAILYEALTGRPPFVAATKLKTLEMVRTAEPVPPTRRRPEVPTWLGSICLKCLEKAPRRRYPTAQALADDLERWLRHERPRGVPGAPRRLARSLRRHVAVPLVALALAVVISALALRDPDRPLRRMEAELARGRAVQLVGRDGGPRWSRWLAGGSRSQATRDRDGFTITSWTLSLLELVPDPQVPSYRLAARVYHRKSDTLGEVGVFFGQRAYPAGAPPLHFFTQVTFNSVRGAADLREQVQGREELRNKPLRPNRVHLLAHLHSDEANPPSLDVRLPGVSGPAFMPRGEDSGDWHDLEVTVTPELVTASWDGLRFSTTASDLRRDMEACATAGDGRVKDRLPPGFVPTYHPRGGVGLYVQRGSASFRDVTLTPLADSQRSPSP